MWQVRIRQRKPPFFWPYAASHAPYVDLSKLCHQYCNLVLERNVNKKSQTKFVFYMQHIFESRSHDFSWCNKNCFIHILCMALWWTFYSFVISHFLGYMTACSKKLVQFKKVLRKSSWQEHHWKQSYRLKDFKTLRKNWNSGFFKLKMYFLGQFYIQELWLLKF